MSYKLDVSIDDNDTAIVLGVPNYDDGLVAGDLLLIEEEIVSWDGFNTANLETNLTNTTNNDLRFTAKEAGARGNLITIEFVDDGPSESLSVAVLDNAIAINLATSADPDHTVTTIASEIITLITNDEDASALVTVTNKDANNGTGLVDSMEQTPLDGGSLSIERGRETSTATSHDSGTDVFLVDQIVHANQGIQVYYDVDTDDPDDLDDTERFVLIRTVSSIIPVNDSGEVDDFPTDEIMPGQLVGAWVADNDSPTFYYRGKSFDGSLVIGNESLNFD